MWYFFSENIARCKKALLQQRGIWDKGYVPDADYIDTVDKRDNHVMWRFFFHAQVWQKSMISYVPLISNLVDTDDVPDTSLSLQSVFFTARSAALLDS